MQTITECLDPVLHIPMIQEFDQEDEYRHFLVYWGYTIYRTYYGQRSGEQWLKLLKNITDGVKKGLTKLKEAEANPDAVMEALDRFWLVIRSVPATLNGRPLEDIRKVYQEGSGADPPVLRYSNLCLIKIREANYDPVAAVPKTTRCGPQQNFGWITMPTTAALDFNTLMNIFTFEQIINHAGGGPGVFWDPDEHL
ncbi:hypothetical protein BM1_08843 [Bipolaris maydis]|nr:hypothetical protein BM1_08843 [Bipolaris maydis]KAJ6279008.1 hypothetical protein J3E71DRAFT_364401 [Bipolaris maydis]